MQEGELRVEEVIANWEEASASEAVKGVALKCLPCGALLLNAAAYKAHLSSKVRVCSSSRVGAFPFPGQSWRGLISVFAMHGVQRRLWHECSPAD